MDNDIITPPTHAVPTQQARLVTRRGRSSREEPLQSPDQMATSSEELLASLAAARRLRMDNARSSRASQQRVASSSSASPPVSLPLQVQAQEPPTLDVDRWLGIAARAKGPGSPVREAEAEADTALQALLGASMSGLREELTYVASTKWLYAKR